jgi:hypothetical protein
MSLHRITIASSLTACAALLTGIVAAPPGSSTAATVSEARQKSAGPNAVVRWNEYAGEAAVAACLSPDANPLLESRMYAVAHLAIHDALQAIDLRSRPYAFRAVEPGASDRAAVAGAARASLLGTLDEMATAIGPDCLAAARQVVTDAYDAEVASLPPGRRTARGLALGERAAAALAAMRADDGSDTPLVVTDYPQGSEPGEWRFTPDRPFAFAPGWGHVEPFALAFASQFRPAAPYPVGSRRYARDFRQVKRLGSDGTTYPSDRTPDQTQTALFWLESAPLAWNRLARSLATQQHLDLWESARLFGLVDAAMADGYIASFAVKYHDLFWRPVTAVRSAGSDGNPATEPDTDWTPLAVTPPVPDHDSAHSVEGGAAAAVLAAFFGRDDVPFDLCSRSLPAGQQCTDAAPVTRHYDGFSDAARENAWSRVLVGFHFWHASQAGLQHGSDIGAWTVGHLLQPA